MAMADEDRDSRRSAGSCHSCQTCRIRRKIGAPTSIRCFWNEKAHWSSSTVLHNRLILLLSNQFWSICKSVTSLPSLTGYFLKGLIFYHHVKQDWAFLVQWSRSWFSNSNMSAGCGKNCREGGLNASGINVIGFEISRSRSMAPGGGAQHPWLMPLPNALWFLCTNQQASSPVHTLTARVTIKGPIKPWSCKWKKRWNYTVVGLKENDSTITHICQCAVIVWTTLILHQHGNLPLGGMVWTAAFWRARLIFPVQLCSNRTSVSFLQPSLD